MSQGRPSFEIDHQRLRNLRNERGWTQHQLSAAIREHLSTWGGKKEDVKATLIANYQRIERKGKTSRKIAETLAKIFGTSIEYLQGLEQPQPDSGDYLRHIESLIRQQLNETDNLELQKEFDQIVGQIGDIKLATETLAREIGERIEAFQLVRDPHEIAELTALTGLSETELLRPANVLEHWFINITSSTGTQSGILHGADQVVWRIKEKIEESCSKDTFTDNSICMWRDGLRYRIEVTRPRGQAIRIVCIRFQPDAKGLRWIEPSWRDEYLIEEPLIYWAKYTFNFICDFEKWEPPKDTEEPEELPPLYFFRHSLPEQQHPTNLAGLRFIVTEHEGQFQRSVGQTVVSGHLSEIHDNTKASFKEAGNSHALFVIRLVADLKEIMLPKLASYPAKCWRVSGNNGIDIHFTPQKQKLGSFFPGIKYRIGLVEEITLDERVPAPWRQKDYEAVAEEIKGWIEEMQNQEPETGSSTA